MAQIFKTISLEERLKNSRYNQAPITPQPVKQGQTPTLSIQQPVNQGTIKLQDNINEVNQGGITIAAKQYTPQLEATQLKVTQNTPEKNSAILKATLSNKQQVLPQIGQFSTLSLASRPVPFVNTKFRSSINLAERLNQPQLGTTRHLAQYFVTDQFTDYITITPFGVFNHTSNIVLLQPATTLNQGGLLPATITFVPNHTSNITPTTPTSNIILRQGGLFSNQQYSSFVTTNSMSQDVILRQGAILYQGNLTSVVSPEEVPVVGSLTTNPNVEPQIPASVATITYLQGIISVSGVETGPIEPSLTPVELPKPVPTNITIINPVELPVLVPNNIVIVSPITQIEQGGTNPTPITFVPAIRTPTLQVLGYSADRSAAFFFPEVKHGSASIRNSSFGAVSLSPLGQNKIDLGILTQFRGGRPINNENGIAPYIQNLKSESGGVNAVKYDNTTGQANNPTGFSIYPANYTQNNPNPLGSALVEDGIDPAGNADQIQNLVSTSQEAFNEKYKTLFDSASYLPYDQLIQREKSLSEGAAQPKQNYQSKRTTPSIQVDPLSTRADNDIVELRIASLVGGGSVRFEAYITSFSDNFTVGWNDLQYVGRQDILKTFKSSTRGGSVGFKVACFTKADLGQLYSRLNSLIKITSVGRGNSAGNTYITGPLCSITVGRWFKDTPCVFNSVKYDIQPADYSWDIDNKMPHLVDVALDFAILGDRAGNPLNATSNNYFDYLG